MESILNLIVNAENVRMLVTLVFSFSCFVWLKTSIKNLEHKMESSIKDLKYNDFAHLMNAFVALTYVLKKNGLLSEEDKEYIDSRF